MGTEPRDSLMRRGFTLLDSTRRGGRWSILSSDGTRRDPPRPRSHRRSHLIQGARLWVTAKEPHPYRTASRTRYITRAMVERRG